MQGCLANRAILRIAEFRRSSLGNIMNKHLLGAVAALAVGAPGLAHADAAGYVGLAYNTLDDNFDANKDDYVTLSGAVVTPLGGNWNLQFDADVGDMNHSSHTDTFATAIAHAFYRNDGWAWGGFAGYSADEDNAWLIGTDGALYLDRFTIAGDALVGENRVQSDNTIAEVSVQGSWFVTDNFSIAADANWFDWEFSGGFSQDGVVYGASAEYQFDGSPFSIYGGYHTANDINGDDVNSFAVGFRYNFGSSSLIDRDRHGASMSGGSQLLRDQVFSW
jgi:hypothetical protein